MYKIKCLYKNSNGTFTREASTMESVWAYLYGTEESKKTGRYRIRITRLSGLELIAMGLAPEGTPEDFYGLQANLDKWNEQYGWIPMLDWVGNPEGDIESIERELGKQFQSFVTGIAIEEDFSLTPVDPASLTKKFKAPKKMVQEVPEVSNDSDDPKDTIETPVPDTTTDSDDDDDIDWI